MPYPRKETVYEVEGSERESPITVGVEIESEFRERNFPVHTDFEPGFTMWYAGTDCTIRHGSEVTSPILQGLGGLAEIIGTAEIIKEETGFMDRNCGQHTTVGDPRASSKRINWRRRVRNLFEALEEGLYALTGDFRRMHGSYGTAVKPHGGDGIRGRGDYAMEMRYPPGTLEKEQIAVNVGVCQLVADLATNLRLGVSRDLREEAKALYNAHATRTRGLSEYDYATISKPNLDFALDFLSNNGWSVSGGDFRGLPYDPDDAPAVLIHDRRKGEYEVHMPNRQQLEAHMEQAITRFCSVAGIERG